MTLGSRIFRHIFKTLAIASLSLVCLALGLEIYLRWQGFLSAQPPNYGCVTGDPLLNHVFRADCQETLSGVALKSGRDFTIRTNALGFRGRLAQGGRPLVVALGDSYTEGYGLEESETFASRLERGLRGLGFPKAEVLNGGILGFSTILYPKLFGLHFSKLRPDLVVLNVDLSDLTDDAYYLQIARYDGEPGEPTAFPGREDFPQWLLPMVYGNHSALLRFAHQEWNQWNHRRLRHTQAEQMDLYAQNGGPWFTPFPSQGRLAEPNCRKPLEAMAKSIRLLQAQVEKVGGRLALHMYPPGYLVKKYPARPNNISLVALYDQKTRKDFSWVCDGSRELVPAVKAFAESRGIAFFESFFLIERADNRDELFFADDPHWSPRGVEVIVNGMLPGLAKLVRQSGLP